MICLRLVHACHIFNSCFKLSFGVVHKTEKGIQSTRLKPMNLIQNELNGGKLIRHVRGLVRSNRYMHVPTQTKQIEQTKYMEVLKVRADTNTEFRPDFS